MQKTMVFVGIFLLAALVLASCSGQTADGGMNDLENTMNNNMEPGNAANIEDNSDGMMDDNSGHSGDDVDNSMDDSDGEMMGDQEGEMTGEGSEPDFKGPAWHAYNFTNVSTGETFSLSQFRGKVVLVETMATWCSNCLKQQQQVKEFHNLLGTRDDFLSVGISLEAGLDPQQLVVYTQDRGFDWRYAIAPQEVQEGILETLGGQFLNPPATPMFILDKDGGMHPLPLGKIKSAAELLALVEPFL
ncbi:MAG: TlpA family protein disulfide reductase [Anaerolineales bacterium]|nr:TlpA family protein disulfide reductase [Anaerolineales bacterium]